MSRESKISLEWYRGLSGKDKDDLHGILVANTQLFRALSEIIKMKIAALQTEESRLEHYSEGYPYKQAFLNGRKAALTDILQILP